MKCIHEGLIDNLKNLHACRRLGFDVSANGPDISCAFRL